MPSRWRRRSSSPSRLGPCSADSLATGDGGRPEWRALETGALDAQINPWAGRMFQTTKQVNPQTGVEQSAYDTWMSQTQQRELARNARIHGAPGLIPVPMWVALYVLATILFTYMLFFADSGGAGRSRRSSSWPA